MADNSSRHWNAILIGGGYHSLVCAACELEIKASYPNAEVVFDLFHVMTKYGHEVVDRVRVDQDNKLRYGKPASRVINPATGCCAITRLSIKLVPCGWTNCRKPTSRYSPSS